jgi:hypothetical protein
MLSQYNLSCICRRYIYYVDATGGVMTAIQALPKNRRGKAWIRSTLPALNLETRFYSNGVKYGMKW